MRDLYHIYIYNTPLSLKFEYKLGNCHLIKKMKEQNKLLVLMK